MKNTALLALSSPEGDSNYYSQLMTLEDPKTGRSFFKVVDCVMICKRCQQLPREKQIDCNHVPQTAHWLSSRKIETLKLLYKASPEVAMREFGGIVVSDYLPCFRKEEIAWAFTDPLVYTESIPAHVFICCDPNGGGPSHMAIASGYYNKMGDLVVSSSQILYRAFLYEIGDNIRHVGLAIWKVECHWHPSIHH
jgi:hypothetical protein